MGWFHHAMLWYLMFQGCQWGAYQCGFLPDIIALVGV
jgi:hypothetical protein